ncbi:cytochrome b/b6 domain-containing protein [uncultured Arcobacter sp.]|uniref:cytochrome b/b6 domain-containing protein n=1 Tax=uncultured Arcobacter sp. TaxID=165434 RepID=UPI0026220706|nr:cytochrome b/b6 domain-containing protein [uncultured Arcobacter sp.]
MENKSFLSEYKAYCIIGLLFILLTYWYFWLATIADINYVYQFLLQMAQGNFTGQVVPFESLTHYQQMEVGLFGPRYDAIAPEVIRAFEERQHLLPIVFLVEFFLFLTMFIVAKGRKQAEITRENDKVQVYSLFQRVVILLNIVIMIYLFITGFSITFGNWTGGGYLARMMRATHEIVGLGWMPIWFLMTIIAFKDHKYFVRPSVKIWNKIFLRGKYKHMDRINYYMFVAFGSKLVISGFIIWYMFPDAATHAETIQIKRFLLFIHFMGSAIISFFTFETVYSYFVSVKGYIPGVITGKLPVEYLEQIRPDVLEEDSSLR